MLTTFLVSAALIGCEKKGETPTQAVGISDIEKIKFQKIERFISIAWGVPINEVLFDKTKNEFSFGEVKMSKVEIERLYDISNEYKLKYENN